MREQQAPWLEDLKHRRDNRPALVLPVKPSRIKTALVPQSGDAFRLIS